MAGLINKSELKIKSFENLIDSSEDSIEETYLNTNSKNTLLASIPVSDFNQREVDFTADKESLKYFRGIEFTNELKTDYKPFAVVQDKVAVNRKVYTVIEFLTEKTQDFASKRAGVEIKSSQDFLTFASNKLKKSKIGKQFRVEDNNNDNQTIKTYRFGKFFKIKRKIKN